MWMWVCVKKSNSGFIQNATPIYCHTLSEFQEITQPLLGYIQNVLVLILIQLN